MVVGHCGAINREGREKTISGRIQRCPATSHKPTYNVMTVGEAFGITLEKSPLLVDDRRNELNMIFHFDVVRLDRGLGWRWKPWTLPDLKAIYTRFDKGLDLHSWNTVYLSNHDSPRAVSHFGETRRRIGFLRQKPWRRCY